MKVLEVHPDSPLFGYVRPGYRLLSINGEPVADNIDFRFKITEELVDIRFEDSRGRELDFQFEDYSGLDMGVTLDDQKVKCCKNSCIFCFVHQQPKGMRRALYVKDEDYRLSFTHGNYVTLSNTTEDDLKRIIDQRLSPLYISVHATDDTLRRCMLRNEKLEPILPRLQMLAENGIQLHTQVVLCPGVNDGAALEKTINDLAGLHPATQTLAVVPVGLTRYRDKLPELRTYTRDEARTIVNRLETVQKELLDRLGSRFVWPADEFYVTAELPFPSRAGYEDMQQFENGVGMAREFITNFNRRRSRLKGLDTSRRVLFLTGESAFPFLTREIMPYVTQHLRLKAELSPVKNRFWGNSVTVSGLLTGQDLLRRARARVSDIDTVVLPPNCLNHDDLFLDNMSLTQFSTALDRRVVVGQYQFADTLREVYS